jgi:hypothetical protein
VQTQLFMQLQVDDKRQSIAHASAGQRQRSGACMTRVPASSTTVLSSPAQRPRSPRSLASSAVSGGAVPDKKTPVTSRSATPPSGSDAYIPSRSANPLGSDALRFSSGTHFPYGTTTGAMETLTIKGKAGATGGPALPGTRRVMDMEQLSDALDELCAQELPFLGRFELNGPMARRRGGQGIVQVAQPFYEKLEWQCTGVTQMLDSPE